MSAFSSYFVARIFFLYLTWMAIHGYAKALIPPSEDPFFQLPPGFENRPVGSMLRVQELSHLSLVVYTHFQNVKHVYQILYRTTDGVGTPTATATTILVPYNADNTKMVVYQLVQASTSSDCSASFILRKAHDSSSLMSQVELLALDSLLERGWYLNIPDYQGPHSFYGVGAMAGHAILDSVRATTGDAHDLIGLNPRASILLWGYSAGALMTGWATYLQSTYAPELNISGAIMGGTPANVNKTMEHLNKTFYVGMAFSGYNSIALQYPEVADYWNSVLLPDKKDAFYHERDLCFSESIHTYAFQDITTYFNRPDYLNTPLLNKILDDISLDDKIMPAHIPLFMYHSIKDPVTSFSLLQPVVKTWCEHGASIEFVEDQMGDHQATYVTGMANAIIHMEKFFDGVSDNGTATTGRTTGKCSHRKVITSLMEPGALKLFVKGLKAAMDGIIGVRLGPKHASA